MSSTNKTTYYELPQYTENDIFNPLADDNDAYEKIDTALHNIADAEADDAAEIVSIKSRLDDAESDIDALEAQNGSDVLTTVAQTLSGAVNELKSGEDSLDGRLDTVEDDINNVSTGLKAKVTALENQNGSEVLTTTAQTLSGAINELDGDVDKLTVFVTPEMFGAVGDGTADDTQAFTDMFAFANTGNLKICVEAKTYNLSKSFVTDVSKILYDKGVYNSHAIVYSDAERVANSNYNIESFVTKYWGKAPYNSYIAPTATTYYNFQSASYSKTRNVILMVFAGYDINTSANDKPGIILEVSPDFSTIYRSLEVNVGHGNGATFCEDDDKWYIASGNSGLGIIVINADTFVAESSKLVNDALAYWTVVYDNDNNVFYCQSGDTTVEGDAKLNVFNNSFSVKLHEVVIDRVYNPTKTNIMITQDAALVNGQYVFLAYSEAFISLTTYNYVTGEITNQIIFSNFYDEEPEGIFIKDNYLYILSTNHRYLLNVNRVLLNNIGVTQLAGINAYIGAELDSRRVISENDDLNDYVSYGHYDCGSGAIATTLTNTPIKSGGFDLFVLRTGYEHIVQIIISNDGVVFTRDGNLWDSTWKAWVSNYYAIGNTITITDLPICGFITNAGSEIHGNIPLPSSLKYISTITPSSADITVRGDSGYVVQNATLSSLTMSFFKSDNGIGMILKQNDSSAFSNVTNNTPVSLQVTITFALS